MMIGFFGTVKANLGDLVFNGEFECGQFGCNVRHVEFFQWVPGYFVAFYVAAECFRNSRASGCL